MKGVIVNSPLFREENSQYNEDSLPPLGLGYIASYLKKNNIAVELIDAVCSRISLNDLINIINEQQPEFIATNIFSTNYELVKEFVESINFKTHIIIGGLATKELYSEISDWSTSNQIDIVIGDGELITLDIINNKLKETPFYNCTSRRVFKINDKSAYFNNDISDLSLNRTFFKNEPVELPNGFIEANIVTSRGCIYNCTFCAAARIQNLEFPIRERSVASIINELNEIKSDYPQTNSIRILDDLFLKTKNNVINAIDIFSKFDFQWRAMANIKTFNQINPAETLGLKESGCSELFFGLESGSPKILSSIKKAINREVIIKNLTQLFKANINVKGYFIFGFPNETIEDMTLTYNLAYDIKNLSLKYGANFRTSVFQFRPYHGAEIFKELINKNKAIEPIRPNKELSNIIGRHQFNFHGENYSEACLDEIHSYICMTNKLNESNYSSENGLKIS